MRSRDALAALALMLLVLAVALPIALSGRNGTSEADDQNAWHLPVIRTMATQWPRVDLVNYESATAPGYHLLLAALTRAGVNDRAGLQVVNAILSALLGPVLFLFLRRFADSLPAFVLALPIVCSPYVISSAAWVTTDDVALLLVLLALILPVTGAVTLRCAMAFAIPAAAAVFVRQVHLWPVGAMALAGALGSPLGLFAPRSMRSAVDLPPRWSRLGLACVAGAAPVAVVGILALMWDGLTPPYFRDFHDSGPNLATPAFALALAGFFLLVLRPGRLITALVELPRRRDVRLAIALALGASVALVVPTDYDMAAGRWGGALWQVVRLAPSIGDRSPVILLLAALGAAAGLILWRDAVRGGAGREVAVLGAAIILLVVVQSANAQCFQRYLEPPLLAALALAIAASARPASATGERAGLTPARTGVPTTSIPIGGAIALAALQLAFVAINVVAPVLRWAPATITP